MTDHRLTKLFEHNNWANERIISACQELSVEQLDVTPASATVGSIREALLHLVAAQAGYLRLLTRPLEERLEPYPYPPFEQLSQLAQNSGAALLALVQDEAGLAGIGKIQTRNQYLVEPWVVLLQVINHATEHREQVKSMLSALGITPPEIDAWDFGLFTGALVPVGNQ
ncbi:MAG: hypothetical protein A2Z16_16115 [Chloroflexi bacterium RBG_16_54_18]|nr:MAG: hypothetical protein A2Z16_16115 [Chloroflexi bacterium RBG_16_54_18]